MTATSPLALYLRDGHHPALSRTVKCDGSGTIASSYHLSEQVTGPGVRDWKLCATTQVKVAAGVTGSEGDRSWELSAAT
jgi:hypothetical protein